MKVIFVSGVKFGHELLKTILEEGLKISGVFSYSDKKQKFYSDFASFDEITKKYNIIHHKVQNINDVENLEILKKIQPDLILVMGWSQLLKDEILKIPRIGIIGSHPTELPKYRGRAPIPWSIIKELKESALSFFWITNGIDNGDLLDQKKFKIEEDDDASTLYEKIISLGKDMILHNLHKIQQGDISKKRQDSSLFIEEWPKRTPEDGKIDWKKNTKKIHNLIRATTHPYPGAFTYFKNSKLIIWNASYTDGEEQPPGKIIDVNGKGVKVATGNGAIILSKISLNNKEDSASNFFSKNEIGVQLG